MEVVKEIIKHEIINPYTPHHNAIIERNNISILNMAINMLQERQLSNNLCGEATSVTIDITNRCPTNKLMNKTPYEAWTC